MGPPLLLPLGGQTNSYLAVTTSVICIGSILAINSLTSANDHGEWADAIITECVQGIFFSRHQSPLPRHGLRQENGKFHSAFCGADFLHTQSMNKLPLRATCYIQTVDL